MSRRVRITGLSVSVPPGFGAGVQLEYGDSDADIARRVITFLEDRRLLWVGMAFEIPEECFRSADAIRQAITHEMQTPGIGAELSAVLGQIRMLLADFMTRAPRARRGAFGTPYDDEEFSIPLGALRAAVGERLAWIATKYGIAVDERLASIIPKSGEWFFETFEDGGTA